MTAFLFKTIIFVSALCIGVMLIFDKWLKTDPGVPPEVVNRTERMQELKYKNSDVFQSTGNASNKKFPLEQDQE